MAEPYGHVVAIADTALEFIHACEALLASRGPDRPAAPNRCAAISQPPRHGITADAIRVRSLAPRQTVPAQENYHSVFYVTSATRVLTASPWDACSMAFSAGGRGQCGYSPW
jgi:hypothetical protein